MIDIHVHLLPGVDDGPETQEQSLAMCEAMAADGITTAVTTVHQRHAWWPNQDRRRLQQLHGELVQAANGRPEILLGAEIRVDSELLDDTDRLPGGELLALAGSKYLLLECDPGGFSSHPRHAVHELQLAGWRPILAHPERIPWLAEDLDQLAELVSLGALVQITAMSLTGELGSRVQETCHDLMDIGLVHFVASDGHNLGTRPPRLGRAFESLERQWGREVAERLTVQNPRKVVEDLPISEA